MLFYQSPVLSYFFLFSHSTLSYFCLNRRSKKCAIEYGTNKFEGIATPIDEETFYCFVFGAPFLDILCLIPFSFSFFTFSIKIHFLLCIFQLISTCLSLSLLSSYSFFQYNALYFINVIQILYDHQIQISFFCTYLCMSVNNFSNLFLSSKFSLTCILICCLLYFLLILAINRFIILQTFYHYEFVDIPAILQNNPVLNT